MNHIEIYISDTCGYCHAAKDFLKEHKLDYLEHNISKDPVARKELMKKGYRSVPVIIINNKEISGFDKAAIIDMLKL